MNEQGMFTKCDGMFTITCFFTCGQVVGHVHLNNYQLLTVQPHVCMFIE